MLAQHPGKLREDNDLTLTARCSSVPRVRPTGSVVHAPIQARRVVHRSHHPARPDSLKPPMMT
jgi:hypothetical protein